MQAEFDEAQLRQAAARGNATALALDALTATDSTAPGVITGQPGALSDEAPPSQRKATSKPQPSNPKPQGRRSSNTADHRGGLTPALSAAGVGLGSGPPNGMSLGLPQGLSGSAGSKSRSVLPCSDILPRPAVLPCPVVLPFPDALPCPACHAPSALPASVLHGLDCCDPYAA